MDILEDLTLCQDLVYKEYNSTEKGSLTRLNEFCLELLKFCNKLHKILICDCRGKFDFIEMVFLCLNQITSCIKYLEKIAKLEKSTDSSLLITKQYFLDRILWCFAKLKSLVNSLNDDISYASTLEETSFISILDTALDLLSPYCSYDDNESTKKSLMTEANIIGEKVRITIDKVLSQALAFANVALHDDKKIISALSQKVLKDCIDFENECKLTEGGEGMNKGIENNIQLKAIIIENALYKLEDFINESLLRLIFHVFTKLNESSVENIRQLIKKNENEEKIDNTIADFDINIDRLMQIGMFAIALSPNSQVKTTVRNCLASLESLDSHLIPSIYSQCHLHSTILEEHFLEEIQKFKLSIQKIIETDSFTESLLNILNESLKIYNLQLLEDNVEMAELLLEHFEINKSDSKLTDKIDIINLKNFKIMVSECKAVLTCANQIDSKRILKRFKILKSCLKKINASIIGWKNDSRNTENEKKVFITSEDLAESQKMLESFGITPSVKKILYENKKNRKDLSDSMIAQCSRQLEFSPKSEKFCSSTERKTVKRRVSLRTAMFKKIQNDETHKIHKIYLENTMDLGLTDILDQITNLSQTFSTINLTEK